MDELKKLKSSMLAKETLESVGLLASLTFALPDEVFGEVLDNTNEAISNIFQTELDSGIMDEEDTKTIEEAFQDWRETYVKLKINEQLRETLCS